MWRRVRKNGCSIEQRAKFDVEAYVTLRWSVRRKKWVGLVPKVGGVAVFCLLHVSLSLERERMAQQLLIGGRLGFRDVRLVKSEDNSLGIGSYGAVYRAKCDQLVCAAKVLHPILFQTRDPAAHRIVERFQREIEFLSGLRHPNVIQYLGSCADPESGLPVLFMELMDESLTSFLERPPNPPPLPLHVQLDIAHDVSQALSHLHRHEVLHRDLSSNNVLLIGTCRAKVTDFGMAKLLGSDPHLTPTYCPGTNSYMSPEALTDPPEYSEKLDVFSCGVLLVQLVTRKFPNPGPRMYTIQVNDPRVPKGRVLVEVPELDRRREHLDLVPPTHPLLQVALDCIKDKEDDRPTSEQLCSRLVALKESDGYRESLRQAAGEERAVQTDREQEMQQQLRERESRVEELAREVQQLQLEKEEDTTQRDQLQQQIGAKTNENQQLQRQIRGKTNENQQLQRQIRGKTNENQQLQRQIRANSGTIRQKSEEIQQFQQQIRAKTSEIQQLQRQIRVGSGENEQVVAALQQSVEQKDAIRAKDELLQEKEREIRELRQRVRGAEGGGVVKGPLKLEWRDGPPAPSPIFGYSVAVSGDMVYLHDGNYGSRKVLMFNSRRGQWAVLPECNKQFFSIAVVNGLLTAIGGLVSFRATNTLLSLSLDTPDISREKWIEKLPPMTYCHNTPAVITIDTSLIVAGGSGPDKEKAPVEVMDTQTLQWSTVASLPHPLMQATATICGERLYLGGGFRTSGTTKSVLMCEVKDLLQSKPQSRATRAGHSESCQVWKEVAPLPVTHSSLVTFQDHLLAVGGSGDAGDTSEVRQYDAATNSWSVISQMRVKRCRSLAVVLPNNTSSLMVCGGVTPATSVEIATLHSHT